MSLYVCCCTYRVSVVKREASEESGERAGQAGAQNTNLKITHGSETPLKIRFCVHFHGQKRQFCEMWLELHAVRKLGAVVGQRSALCVCLSPRLAIAACRPVCLFCICCTIKRHPWKEDATWSPVLTSRLPGFRLAARDDTRKLRSPRPGSAVLGVKCEQGLVFSAFPAQSACNCACACV